MAERTKIDQYAAGVVLYNPELNRLKLNLDSISKQVKKVYCYNNGLLYYDETITLLNSYNNIQILGDGQNQGIATALNEIIRAASNDGMEWVLTLDQDSVACEGMVDSLASLKYEKNVAIITPLIEDVRRKNQKPVVKKDDYDDLDFCITSGSFMNIEKTLDIGGFDDYLFIGLVDNDICYRIKSAGYRILRNNNVVLNHELGNLKPSKFEKIYLTLGDFLHCENIKKLSYKRSVSPLRLYYATRNMIYLNYKYSDKKKINLEHNFLYNGLSCIIRGNKKIKLIYSFVKGIIDGREYVKKLKKKYNEY